MIDSTAYRFLAGRQIPAVGLGCMNLSHAYGHPPSEQEGLRLLQRAFDLGYRYFDTATLYGFGRNESLLGKALQSVRSEILLASKGGMAGVDGKRTIDGRPATLRRQIDESLSRLRTDHIDLYYLHRLDPKVPVEESLGALTEAVAVGKIGAIGLSEVSRDTLERALRTTTIAAVQNEYSPWTRNCELGISQLCREAGVTLVAFSPICRGFLGTDWTTFEGFVDGDIRRKMPRFERDNIQANQVWLRDFRALASGLGITASQLALAWLLAKGEHLVPIPGTTDLSHLEENFAASGINLPTETITAIDRLVKPQSVAGNRYPEATQAEIDTERFPFENPGS